MSIGLLRRLAAWKATKYSRLIGRSGQIGNASVVASSAVAWTVAAAVVLLPPTLTLSLAVSPLFAVLSLGVLFPYLVPEIRLRDAGSRRREGIERELPFFSILVSVLGGAGVSLYSIFESLAATDIFSSIKGEALLVIRDVKIFGVNPNDSFEKIAEVHPSGKFSQFLTGYTSKVQSGGDLPSYLAGESGSLLRELEEGWARYAASVGIVGSMMITVFGVVPLLLMVIGMISPGTSIVGLVLFCGVGVPLFTTFLLYLAGRMQPAGEEPLEGKAPRSLLVSLPGVALGVITKELWVGAALMLGLFFTSYGLSVKQQLVETKACESGTIGLLKDLMEFKRQDYDLTKAMVTIASKNKYNQHFDKLLSSVASRLRSGHPLDAVVVQTRSRLTQLAFFLLGQMSRSGGGTVDTLYQLSVYSGRLVEVKRAARAEMRPYLILSYLSPLLLAFGVAFMGGVLGSFSRTVRPSFAAVPLSVVQVGAVPPGLAQVSSLLIVVSAAALGLIGAKITDLTVRNTLPASANVGIAVVAIVSITALNIHSLV